MTERAKSLTKDVKPASAGEPVWYMPAGDLRTTVSGLERLGYPIDSLLDAVGLGDFDLGDPDAQVPCTAYGALLQQAQRTRFTPNLALELAKHTPIGAYPLLDYLVLTSDTVSAGIRQLARYIRIVGSPVPLNVQEGDPVRIEMTGTALPFAFEFSASLLVLHMRTETDGRFHADGVSFRHTPDDVAAFERSLGCVVTGGADSDAVTIPLDVWRLPMRRRDPILRQVLEHQANEIVQRSPVRTGLAQDVQRALATRVAGGDTRIDVVARELAMSGRTLQRRLASEGVSYQELLEASRKEAARRCMTDSTLAISEIAYLLGYSEPASFHRAFKRWYEMTPDAFRKTQRVGL
jgi:AraC-like DNA-binding protein